MFTIPVIPRAYLWAAVAVVVSLVIANTYRLSAAVDRAEAKLATCQSEQESLKAALEEQNVAVEEMKQGAEKAKARAEKALADAEAAEKSRQLIEARLLSFKRLAGESECDAAARILLEYRKP